MAQIELVGVQRGSVMLPTTGGKYDAAQTVLELKARIKRLGIDLDRHIGEVTNKWDKTPRGFAFVCWTDSEIQSLCQALDRCAKIGRDAVLSQMFQKGASWREVNPKDGLHILWLPGKPYSTYANPVTSYFNIHLDSVSVCHQEAGGYCETNWPSVIDHWKKDKWNK